LRCPFTPPGREADGFRDLRERDPRSRIPFCAGTLCVREGSRPGGVVAMSIHPTRPRSGRLQGSARTGSALADSVLRQGLCAGKILGYTPAFSNEPEQPGTG
jgi:hypothetical protein